ncbi:MAG: hypothetical protein WDZ35_09175 [Crocinitomicaceae bacterium]
MRKIFYLTIPFFLLNSCNNESQQQEMNETADEVTDQNPDSNEQEEVKRVNSFLIEQDVVGIFQLGNEVPELPKELKMRHFTEEVTLDGEIIKHTHNVVFNQLEDVVELIMNQNSDEFHDNREIEEMIILSSYYETEKGITVGSTKEEFKAAYPEATLWYSPGKSFYFLDTETIPGAQFVLNPKGCKREIKGGSATVQMKWSDFKEDAEIEKIRLY